MTRILANAINLIVQIFSILILVEVLASWITVANVRLPDPILRLLEIISQITGVILNPIRRVIPSIGGLDISPIVALLLLDVVRRLLISLLIR